VDTTRALTRAQVAAIWKLDVPLRDKALSRMLYESAARAEEILGLDVPDLDLPGKRGRVISKGGTTDWVHWQTGTAMLLPRLLAGRREGPVFLTARKPCRAVASGDLCPGSAGAGGGSSRAPPLALRGLRRGWPAGGSRTRTTQRPAGRTAGPGRWPCSLTRPRTAPAPRCCSPGPGTPPSGPSSATPAPDPRPSHATSPAPTRPRAAATTNASDPAARYLAVILIVVFRWMIRRAHQAVAALAAADLPALDIGEQHTVAVGHRKTQS